MSSKRRSRPWDKVVKKRIRCPPQRNSEEEGKDDGDVPFVEVEQKRFYSDRFYLNTTIYDDDDDDALVPASVSATAASCRCGARQSPPFFDRAALVNSLDLKAAIFGTYTMSFRRFEKEFPKLFGKDATIPTLVLHGRKGWTVEKHFGVGVASNEEEDSQSYCQESPPDHGALQDKIESDGKVAYDDADESTVNTQQDETVKSAQEYTFPISFSPLAPDKPQSQPNSTSTQRLMYEDIPSTVHFSEITAAWIPPNSSPSNKAVSAADLMDENGCLSPDIVQKRQNRMGVHHPKFMILFEKSGSVVVVVSTANMTSRKATDGSWVQRFPSVDALQQQQSPDTCDFGAVLSNFLQCQMIATRAGQLTTLGFLQRYMGYKSFKAMERSFAFEQACAHLVPVVPGDFETERSFHYGRQRVNKVLLQLSAPQHPKPWLSSAILSHQDRLVMQPTSFGAEWKESTMADVVRSYLNDDGRSSDDSCLKRMDIVWPTRYFVQQTRQLQGKKPPNGSNVAEEEDSDSDNDNNDAEYVEDGGGYLFLSTETFNRIKMGCLSQMVMYEPTMSSPQVPHFKSIARLFEGSDNLLRTNYKFGKSSETFSWFLLTSACLSRGAQGVSSDKPRIDENGRKQTTVSYANFELGVLFVSRLQGTKNTDRLYCYKPLQCTCHTTSGANGRLVHLPIPYCLRPARYQKHEDHVEFCETPYFHELVPGSACVGNMLSTPYGEAIAAAQHDQEKSKG